MKYLSLGSLVMMNNDAYTGYIVEQPIQGLDSAEYRESLYDRPGADGSVLSSLFYGARTLTLTGNMSAGTPAAYEALRQGLSAACVIQRDDTGQPLPITLSFTTRGNQSYFCNVYARKPVFDYEYATTGAFMVNLVVPDGFIYGASQVTTGVVTPPTGGGFSLPTHIPITSSATVGGSVTVSNSGTLPAYPVVTLTGPLTNPYLASSATGEYMQVNYTINGGDIVTIDMADHTILLNNSSSLIGTKVTGSSWWSIPSGTTSISLSTASTSDTGNAQASFYPVFAAA